MESPKKKYVAYSSASSSTESWTYFGVALCTLDFLENRTAVFLKLCFNEVVKNRSPPPPLYISALFLPWEIPLGWHKEYCGKQRFICDSFLVVPAHHDMQYTQSRDKSIPRAQNESSEASFEPRRKGRFRPRLRTLAWGTVGRKITGSWRGFRDYCSISALPAVDIWILLYWYIWCVPCTV